MDRRSNRTSNVDLAVLSDLATERMDYPTLIANRCGIHEGSVERACERLTAKGLLERTSEETTYRITERGRHYLEHDVGCAEPSASTPIED